MDYKTSGVDIEEGRKFVSQIKEAVEETYSHNVMQSIGGFGGLFKLPIENYQKPILVSGTDGVGTKLELAQQKNSHFSVGIDLVAMCINDIITSGASPLFFLDYIATGRLDKLQLTEVVKGIAKACKDNECSLLGGETAEMPGFYAANKYDLAGFCVGIVEEEKLINGEKIREDDLIIALESSGVHSNGFSLVRKVIDMSSEIELRFENSTNLNFYQELLKPTTIYSNVIKQILLENIEIKGMAHITGGGLPENLPRCMPKKYIPHIDKQSWDIPFLFQFLKDAGQIPDKDLWNTFNLGVGFCLVVDKEYKNSIFKVCETNNIGAWEIGKIIKREFLNKDKVLNGVLV